MSYVPVAPLSAQTGYNLKRVFALLDQVHHQCSQRIGTGELNQLLKEIIQRVQPPRFHGRQVKFYYFTQAETQPPTFVAFVNHPEGVPDAYRRYLVKQLRAGLNLSYAPLRLFLKKRQRRR